MNIRVYVMLCYTMCVCVCGVRNDDAEAWLGCIKCSRCFISVGFIASFLSSFLSLSQWSRPKWVGLKMAPPHIWAGLTGSHGAEPLVCPSLILSNTDSKAFNSLARTHTHTHRLTLTHTHTHSPNHEQPCGYGHSVDTPGC